MIIGGLSNSTATSSVEIYSPNGLCNVKLSASSPSETNQFLVLIANSLLYCGNSANLKCWTFQFGNKSWNALTSSQNTHPARPAKVYQQKLYIAEDVNPEVYNSETDIWSTWERPMNTSGAYACSAIWGDTLLVLEGLVNNHLFYQFNFTIQVWNNLPNSQINFDWPACLILPTDQNKLLVTGFENMASIYDLIERQWTSVGNTSTFRIGGELVALGKRVFYLSGIDSDGQYMNTVEEFHFQNKSWTWVNQKIILARKLFKSISIPAFLLQNEYENCTGVK